jgi:hypothetical protein
VSNPGPPLPGEFTIQSTLRQHFGDRYAMTWLTSPHQPDGGDRRVVVAVVSPSDGDRSFVRSIPDIGDRVIVVGSKYSATQLDQFQATLAPLLSSSSSSGQPIITSTGQEVRDENFTATGSPVLRVGVTACDPGLIQRITALVPADVVQLRLEDPIRAVGG